MSLFSHVQTSATVQFRLQNTSDVAVGPALWEYLVGDAVVERLALSIASPDSHGSRQIAVSCWAILDPDADALIIPAAWVDLYEQIFSYGGEQSVVVTMSPPTPLTEVVVSALSIDAYNSALKDRVFLETTLSQNQLFLRQGHVHHILFPSNEDGSSQVPVNIRFRLDMTAPVLQGFAQLGKTKFVLTLDEEDVLETTSNFSSESETESEEGIEIDEGFLANAVWTSNPSMGSFSPRVAKQSTDSSIKDEHIRGTLPESEFKVTSLRKPVSHAHDADCTVYLRTADLGRVGMLNGDWAVAKSDDASKQRLVRVYAADHVASIFGTLLCSPVLLSNLSSASSQVPGSPIKLTLQASPFGSNRPSIPTARTITIARVASCLSTDKSFQPLFLRGLKAYFNDRKPLVKQGDVIAIPINTNLAVAQEEGEEAETESHSAEPTRKNAHVFFLVTNIEYDVVSLKEDRAAQDTYVGSTIGELGCWVDPALTRMIQTGIEHLRIPDVSVYSEFERQTPSAFLDALEQLPKSQLLSPTSPFGKTLAIGSATLAQHAVDYNLHLSLLMKGSRGTGKFTVASWVAQRLGMHLLEINCYDVIGENDTKTEGTLRARFDKASTCSPCVLVLRHIDALAQTTQVLESGKEPIIANTLRDCMNELQQTWRLTGYPTLVVATTSEPEKVPAGVLSCFKHEIAFEAPSEIERREMFSCLLTESTIAPDVSVPSLATQTAALVAADIVDLVTRAKVSSIKRAMYTVDGVSEADVARAGVALTAADFDVALGKARAAYSESIGAPKIPNVTWDDVGGLAHVKSDILDTIQLPLEHPELFADGLKKRSGILLYGPPGTGKTLLAKAVATSCALNFFSVKGPELLNMYIGESEANVRRVFQRARDAKPCVIFFDELDSVAPKRGNQGDSGGVMDRIVSQLLAELDGMSDGDGGADVFVIGATNRPDLLDPALLRPGRFDRMLYLGVSDTHEAQLNILEALTRKFRLDPGLSLRTLAEQCPFNYTGADFYALCSDAMLNAMSRKAEELEATIAELNKLPGPYEHPHPLTPQYYLAEIATQEEMAVLVSQTDFDSALRNLVPSVTQAEMDHYAVIQQRFSRVEPKDEDEKDQEQSSTGKDKGKGKARALD